MTTDLWLIRHARPSQEAHGRCYGSLDVPLAADAFADLQLPRTDVIYSSPRLRCIQTAHLISPSPIILPDVREIDFGDFEGKTYDEIAAIHPELYAQWMSDPTAVTFPNGESFSAMRERVLSAVHSILQEHAGKTIAVVSHGGVNRILLAEALGLPDRNLFRIGQRYGALNLLRYYGSYPVVELLNGATHSTSLPQSPQK